MKLNRELQKHILELCAKEYPRGMTDQDWRKLMQEIDEAALVANLTYLYQHGLMKQSVVLGGSRGGSLMFNLACLCCTEKGMDFIADDGGLSAILGVVTIKLHGDTLRDLLERKILESDTPPAEKRRLVQDLKRLPAEATKHLIMKLLDKGLEHLPGAVALIGTYLQQNLR